MAKAQAESGGVTGAGSAPHTGRRHDCLACHYCEVRSEGSPQGDNRVRYGWCRRYAPRPVMGGQAGYAAWPSVHSGDYCGEFVQADD